MERMALRHECPPAHCTMYGMARPKRETCVHCERHIDECGPLSARGKCLDCGIGRALDAAEQLRAHRGPLFEKWRVNHGAAVGAGRVGTPAHRRH